MSDNNTTPNDPTSDPTPPGVGSGDRRVPPPPAAPNPYGDQSASTTPPPPPNVGQAPAYPGTQTGAYGDTSAYAGAQPAGTNVSAIVLTVVAALASLSCYFTLAGIPALVLGIMALVKQKSDMPQSRKLAKIGWIVFGVIAVLCAILIAVGVTTYLRSEQNNL